MTIQESIKAEIKRRGLSIAVVAEKLDVIPSNLSRTINNPNIRLSDMEKIAYVIGCSVADFFQQDNTPSKPTFTCPHCGMPINVHVD